MNKKITSCGICGGQLAAALDMPGFPLTGIFVSSRPRRVPPGTDQRLLWCRRCGHAQLQTQLDPAELYDRGKYAFRTSASANARAGTAFFLNFVKEATGGRRRDFALDVGCNDLHLLREAAPLARQRLGVDPIWKGGYGGKLPRGVSVLGKTAEEIDPARDLPKVPDLIFCRHTIEHIGDPAAVLASLMALAGRDTLFVFETPSFSVLLERARFGQVFHEHMQYFSPASIERLVRSCGGEVTALAENYHDWGAMAVAFRKRAPGPAKFRFEYGLEDIRRRAGLFRAQMDGAAAALGGLRGRETYGFGAAMMLPVLAYYLRTDFSFLKAVLDDDAAKDGLYYANLPVRIRHAAQLPPGALRRADVLVTAVDNARGVISSLIARGARNVVYPYHII